MATCPVETVFSAANPKAFYYIRLLLHGTKKDGLITSCRQVWHRVVHTTAAYQAEICVHGKVVGCPGAAPLHQKTGSSDVQGNLTGITWQLM